MTNITTDVVASTAKKINGAALAPGVTGRVEWVQTEKDDLFSSCDVLSLVDVQAMLPIQEVMIGDTKFATKEEWEQKPIQKGQKVVVSLKNTSGRFAPGQVIFWVAQTNGEAIPITIDTHGEVKPEESDEVVKVSAVNALRQGPSTDVVIHLTRRHAEVAARVLRYPMGHGIAPHELQIVAQAVATAVSRSDARPKAATFRQGTTHRRGTR